MAQNKWQMPATTSDDSGTAILTWFPNAFANLRTLHGGTLDPSTPANDIGSAKHMLWADETNSKLKMRNVGDTAWYTLGPLQDYLGAYQINASNPITAALEGTSAVFFTATAGPTHTSGDKWFAVKENGGSTYYVHAQQTKP